MRTTALVSRNDESAVGRAKSARLSVCCLTAGLHLPRTAAILGLLRPITDEIIVAVDARARESAPLLAGVADRILLFSHVEPSDRPIPWLVRQCAGNWVFNVDDDEIPSTALLAELPALIGRSDLTHCWIARKWLYPDVSTFLDQPPWNTEYQLRLFKADSRFLQFTDQFHLPVRCQGPARFVDAPLWHLDTALCSEEDRRRKAMRYEQLRRGMRIGAFSHNTGLYLPELHGDVVVADVPIRELATIKETLLAPARRGGPTAVEEAMPEAVEREWPGPPYPPALYEASISLLSSPPRVVGGVQQTIDVRVENRGDCIWRTAEEITLGTRWNDHESIRTALPADVLPGESAVVPLHVIPPADAGWHVLDIDLVHEQVRWFDRRLRLLVEVIPRRLALVAGRGVGLSRALDVLSLTPDIEPMLVKERGDPDMGHLQVDGAGRYLFGADGTAGWRAIPRGLWLLLGTRRGTPAAIRPLVNALEGSELLIVVDDDRVVGAPPTRDHLRTLIVVALARRRGVPARRLGSSASPATSRVDRALQRLLYAAAQAADPSTITAQVSTGGTNRTP